MNGLATIDPADINLARFLVFALLGADRDGSPWTQSGERVARLAVSGIRLVIEQLRSDVTKTRQDGTPGALRIDYGSPQTPEEPIAWLWKYLDGARSASELYGRALVVILAEQQVCRLVVPRSQQTPPLRWESHRTRPPGHWPSSPRGICRGRCRSCTRRSNAPADADLSTHAGTPETGEEAAA
jgi:hypothetical protein